MGDVSRTKGGMFFSFTHNKHLGHFHGGSAMLVLSRKPGESIIISNDIKIIILEIRGNRVRVGIAAPEDVPISRAELNEFWIEPTADEPVLAR